MTSWQPGTLLKWKISKFRIFSTYQQLCTTESDPLYVGSKFQISCFFFPPSAEWWVLVFNNRRPASHQLCPPRPRPSPPPPHPRIRRQFYTFSTSYWAKTKAKINDYRSVPYVDTSTVLQFQHFILIIIIIIIIITNSSTVLHFQHFILTSY